MTDKNSEEKALVSMELRGFSALLYELTSHIWKEQL